MTVSLIFAAVFAAAFLAVDHRLSAPSTWQRSSLEDSAAIKKQVLQGTPPYWIAFVLLFVVSFPLIWFLPLHTGVPRMSMVGVTAGWLGWEACSLLWSANTLLSLRHLIPWIVTAAVGLATGAEVGLQRCVLIIALVCSVFLVAGIGNELFQSSRDGQTVYRFAGTLRPTRQGINCAMLVLSYCYLGSTRGIPSGFAIAGMLAGVGGLGLTRSRAPFWSAEAAAVVWAALTPFGTGRLWPFGLAAGILLAGIVVSGVGQAKVFLNSRSERPARALSTLVSLGRPNKHVNTLNNRTTVWRLVLPAARQHWFAGVGFGAFWDASRIDSIQAAVGRMFRSCHSTFFEIFVRSGVIGVILFIATLLVGLVVAFSMHRADSAFFCSIFVFVLIQAFVESVFALPNFASLFMFLLLGALAAY